MSSRDGYGPPLWPVVALSALGAALLGLGALMRAKDDA